MSEMDISEVALVLILAPFVLLFIDGFMSSTEAESSKNETMTSFLTLVGKVYYPVNRFGAWLRRLLQGVKKA